MRVDGPRLADFPVVSAPFLSRRKTRKIVQNAEKRALRGRSASGSTVNVLGHDVYRLLLAECLEGIEVANRDHAVELAVVVEHR